MSEKHITNSHENNHQSGENLREEHDKHAERLRNQLERAENNHKELGNEHDALKEAQELAKEHAEKPVDHTASPAERRRGPLTKKQLNGSFASQMNHAREHMNPASRAFSRFIHTKPIEALSDFAASTVARPNALLMGSIVAFVAVTILYFVANHFGFRLSGFETIGAFVIGWIIGIVYDYASVAFHRRKQ